MKIRLIGVYAEDWDSRMGPAIGEANDVHFLKNEDWLEVKRSTIAECKKDKVIPWVRSGGRGALLEAEKLEWPIILGPNCVFSDSNNPLANEKELTSPYIHRLLWSDYDNMELGKKYCTYDHDKLRQVPYFMRPHLYEEPFLFEHEWDIYCHVKTSLNIGILQRYMNHTMTSHGWYKFKELKYKAQHSKVCIHACHYDNYGLAVHEISILGCPLVYDKFGMKRGASYEGLGVEVSNVASCPVDELDDAVAKAMSMDRKKVWEVSKEAQSVKNCLERYRKAIL